MGLTFDITDDSHADHLDAQTLNVVREIMRDGESRILVDFGPFQIHEVYLPAHMPSVHCALRGPTTGEAPVTEDQCHYGTRGGRPNISRLTDLPATLSLTVTVLVSEIENGRGTLVTAYGGPLAPQEPGDPYLPEDGHEGAVKFWAEHALSVDGSPDSTREPGYSFERFSAPAEKADA